MHAEITGWVGLPAKAVRAVRLTRHIPFLGLCLFCLVFEVFLLRI